jgi:hypothetical protein
VFGWQGNRHLSSNLERLTSRVSCATHFRFWVSVHTPFTKHRYAASFVNSRKKTSGASAKGFKNPVEDTNFTMRLPAGVTLKSHASSTKLGTAPVVDPDTNMLTWDIGAVMPGKRVRLTLKMVADACTTPAALALDGKFSYVDGGDSKTVDACLKKSLYVWTKGCPKIPKSTLGHNKDTHSGGHGQK